MSPLQPTLDTGRLHLRLLRLADAPDIQRLASSREVASSTGMIPHPYPEGAAAEFINLTLDGFERERAAVFGIVVRNEDCFIGCCGLHPEDDHGRAELGYWVGVPWWNRGYATEAAAAVVGWGFRERGIHRIFAGCFARNPASARVLEKAGFTFEGRSREHFRKWEVYEDILHYGLLRSEWEKALSS
jgi:RimJ/RimL family protein N-acetyltransferase